MSTCAVVDSSGVVSATSTPVASCTSLVLLSPDDYAYATAASPWVLSVADGVQVGVAVLGVWALGFAFRALVRALAVDEGAA